MFKQTIRTIPALGALVLAACGDSTGPGQEQELISRVTLTLTPVGGGAAQVVYIDDADGLGPGAPSAQVGALQLQQGRTYTGSVLFENRLTTPAENITEEVAAEDDTHMVIYTVSGATGSTITTTDTDGTGRQLGLAFNATPGATLGAGSIRVVLCHFDATPKPTTATACGGDTDIDLSFGFSVIAPATLR